MNKDMNGSYTFIFYIFYTCYYSNFRNLNLRADEITQGNCQRDILRNASLTEDEYFVAPIGNIPLHEVEVDKNNSKELHQIKRHDEN